MLLTWYLALLQVLGPQLQVLGQEQKRLVQQQVLEQPHQERGQQVLLHRVQGPLRVLQKRLVLRGQKPQELRHPEQKPGPVSPCPA
ncbi:hypothetical protein AA0481_0001 [Acetobacter orientalis NRIC 0481]|uniref:Uncharacterized protein n=1 Tax=Acetobacter orientalis TaxID=146474 RepID=A0A0D6NH18_9PROT|nr:hypothetical protein Abor_002_106 [Acetobacter orientalis]GBR12260.1 hypothetical protein AA0481_0001 [Acetobacter orientalis NRIC 0481]GEL61342.1 hypothetical protein AOR02nite_11840 [Acetobacter orientalis]